MDPVTAVVALANKFYELAALAKANKGQCGAIADRIKRLVRSFRTGALTWRQRPPSPSPERPRPARRSAREDTRSRARAGEWRQWPAP